MNLTSTRLYETVIYTFLLLKVLVGYHARIGEKFQPEIIDANKIVGAIQYKGIASYADSFLYFIYILLPFTVYTLLSVRDRLLKTYSSFHKLLISLSCFGLILLLIVIKLR